ncbi:MAG: hypothetical protein OXB88_00160 [Bacteriovoracales bacterium]|nr:hypothetical protein [Bacteriovoracales bacterium]
MAIFSFVAVLFLWTHGALGSEDHHHHHHSPKPSKALILGKDDALSACTHPQVCALVVKAQKALKIDSPPPRLAFALVGDPHHFSPSPKLIKRLTKTQSLFAPHLSLWPWGRKILQMRRKDEGKKTFTLGLPPDFKSGRSLSKEAVAHFWLSPSSYCHAFKETVTYIKSLHAPRTWPSSTPCPHEGLSRHFKKAFGKTTAPFVLNHDALVPLLEEYNVPYLSLRTSGHHAELGPKDLKRAMQFLARHKKVYWVWESQIKTPKAITAMKRKGDKNLRLDTLGKENDQKAPLEVFMDQLKKTF